MSDPVRLGDVLARELQRLDAACECGHPLSVHVSGMYCVAGAQLAPIGCPLDLVCKCSWYCEAKCTP